MSSDDNTEERIIEFDEGWSHVQVAIGKLKNMFKASASESESPFKAEESMMIYTIIYNMCSQKYPHNYCTPLYEKFTQTFDEHITSEVLPSLREKQDEPMLREFVQRWAHHKLMVKWLSVFLHYLDRFLTDRMSFPSLKEVGLTRFHDLVFLEVKGKVRDVVISVIDQERKGDQINRGLLKDVLDIFVEIGKEMEYYVKDFEEIMLKETAAYYSRKASNWIVEDSCPDYILKVEECLRKEKDRVSHYLHSSSESKLLEIVQNELLVKYAKKLLENEEFGFIALLMADDKVEDLSRTYRLFHKIPEGLELMANMFKQQISNDEAMALVQQHDAEEPQVYVRKVTELHEKYMAYVIHTCLSNDNLFRKVIKEAFEVLCNKKVGGSSSSELLASYYDETLKGASSEELSDKKVRDTVEKVGKLLGYINDKDMFGEFYRNKLSRRLLIDKSANEYHERLILSTFRQHCGEQFTSKMEGMVTDMTLAKENQNLWKEYLMEKYKEGGGGNPGGIDFNVSVLTAGFWPTSYKPFDHISLPAEMMKCIEVFKEFYETITNNRKLKWINSLGTCNIQGNFESKTINLNVSTYQGAVLMLFNSADRLSYSEIKTQLNLGDEDDDDLIRILESLSSDKYKILIKEEQSPNPNNTLTVSRNEDYFEFNTRFTHRMPRIKIPWPSPLEERKNVTEVVDKDRRHAVDASIVRIMKSRRVLSHQQLVMECVGQLGAIFKPEIKLIKQRIESLISRDFLERDRENPSTYCYIT